MMKNLLLLGLAVAIPPANRKVNSPAAPVSVATTATTQTSAVALQSPQATASSVNQAVSSSVVALQTTVQPVAPVSSTVAPQETVAGSAVQTSVAAVTGGNVASSIVSISTSIAAATTVAAQLGTTTLGSQSLATTTAAVTGTVTGAVSAAISGTAALGTGTTSAPIALATGAAPANNTGLGDSSALPNGITEVKRFPMSDFCRQFVGQNGIVEGNGTQLRQGGQSCSNTPLGLLPSVNRMMSTLIIEPAYGATLDATRDNIVVLNTRNLDSGFFNDPNRDYYLIPSTLSADERIIQGHQHVTVEALGNGQNPLDPRRFAFFKGVNDREVDPQFQRLQAVILANTLKENGPYRICSITGSAGHQSAISPVQQRGPQDDCIRVTVINAPGGQNVNVVSDNAENTKVTINGQDTNRAATSDNSGRDAGGSDMNREVAQKNAERDRQAGAPAPKGPQLSQPAPPPAPLPNTGNTGNLPTGGNTGNAPTGGNTGNAPTGGNTGNAPTGGSRLSSEQIIAQLRTLLVRMQQILSQ
jgi:hypothetical protein